MMFEQQELSAEGSSVDPGEESEQAPERSPSGTQKRTDDQVGCVRCPRCGYGISLDHPEDGEEGKPESMDPDQNQTLEDQYQELTNVLEELKHVLSKEDYINAEHLVKESINLSQRGRQSLLVILQNMKPVHHKPVKVRKNTSSSLLGIRLTDVKVLPVVTGKTCGADDVILEQLMKGGWFSTKVEVVTDVQDCNIIILFCPITSRVGTDVDEAMKKIPGDKPVILVLMHHTRHDDHSVDNKRWNDKFRNVVLGVNVLFHETHQRGLLKCTRNNKAVEEIQGVLKNHSKRSYKELFLC